MRKFVLMMMAVLAMFVGMPSQVYAAGQVKSTRGVVRVKLQPEVAKTVAKAPRLKTSAGKVESGVSSLDHALNLISGVNIRPMLPPNPKFAAQRAKYGLDQWYVVTFDEALAPESIVKSLTDVAGVMKAEVVKPMVCKEGNKGFVVAGAPTKAASTTAYPFNDPYLPDQWHYKNFGDKAQRVAGADINLFDAWKIATGKKDIIVAIIDGGIDYSHEDLAANMYVNEKELNGVEGYDDDGDGYIDDVYGYNFCTQSGAVYPHEHGTHVAGTVAAVNNNGIGVCGVAGGDGTANSGVKLLSCQVFDGRQGAGDGDFAAAIVYAAEKGATIAQCSWGWSEAGYCEEAVVKAIDYFTETARSSTMAGGLMIFAAGNNGMTGDFYPACLPNVLAVGSMTSELTPASYSNYGAWVDVMAPGGLMDYSQAEGVMSTLPNGKYGYNEGTSMATPHVSGIAALVLAKYGSPEFTNESLRTQLETSVKDFYGFGNNEQYRGLYGSGYVDANKALQMGDGSAPNAVTDFTLQASQDYILVEWKIPAASENSVHSHIVYYSTEPFTAESDLSKVKSLIADTKFLYSGDSYTQKISGLSPLTKYYIAIKAVSRQGKASELSPVKEISTNEGPKMTLNVSKVTLNSTADAPTAQGAFTIQNDADGILSWSVSSATVSMSPSQSSRCPGTVVPGVIARNHSGKVGYELNASKASGTVTGDYVASDYPKNLKYYDTYYAVLGESDKTIPNSMAQLFWVDPEKYPDGFNLTSIVVDFTYGTNPKIEIYKGPGMINSANLIQDVKYNYFFGKNPVALSEQVHFEPGASFWIVVHFEGNQSGYPLPAAFYSDEYSYVKGYSYMSFDLGKSWLPLKTALAGSIYESDADRLTWGIAARSDNPDFSECLVLNPASGTVPARSTQDVAVSADGSKLVNGTYKFNIQLSTNEVGNQTVKLPVNYTVKGNTHDIQVPKVVDFGSLLVGQEKTLNVEVFNNGYGAFSGRYGSINSDAISSTTAHFTSDTYIQGGIPARSKVSFQIKYKPVSSGSHTGSIVIKDKDGKEFRVIVRGVATDPAKLSLDPAVVDAGTLNVGDEASEVKFKVVNTGNYPMEYVFPKFTDKTVEGSTSYLHKFGYSVTANIEGYNTEFAYDNNPELTGGTDVKSEFGDYVAVSSPISMGFSFPYYGKNYDKVYITSYGALCFAPNTMSFWSPLTPESESLVGLGFISAYGRDLKLGADSKVEYFKQDGKFIVKYTNVLGLVYGAETKPISFRIILSGNGDIEIFYDDYTAAEMFQDGSGLFCAINDPEMEDYLSVTDADMALYAFSASSDAVFTEENQRFTKFNSGTSVKFSAPKASFVRSLDKPYGLVSPNESVELTATVQADETLDAGATFNTLAIVTNDPNPDYTFVKINAEIVGEGLVAVAALEDTEIDLGDKFRTSEVKTPVIVKNNGHDKLEITNIEVEGEGLSLADAVTLPLTLDPRMAKDINVAVATDETKAISGTVKVTTSAGELVCTVKANIVGVPTFDLNLTEVEESVASGAPLHKDLVVSNNGNEPLVYSITPDPIVSVTLPENETAKTSYVYTYSEDENDLEYAWEDIVSNGLGTHTPMSYFNLKDYVEVELPFEFPYYGEKYNKMYIYNTGFVSFTYRKDENVWPEPPVEFPGGTIFTNIIAPYWGLHSPNQTTTSGTYHYVTEDRAVISWMEYGNSMNYDVCYQLIMEKDGTFKFQYMPYSYSGIIVAAYGVAGASNVDGTSGVRLPEYMIKFGTAVSFAPVTEATVAAGASETIGMDFNTNRMAGEYHANIQLASNVPSKEKVNIPVTLNISGTPNVVWPGDVEVEHPLGYYDLSNPLLGYGAAYGVQLTVENTGTADFQLAGMELECELEQDPYDDSEDAKYPMFQLYYYGNANSGIGGWEPLSESGSLAWVPYAGDPVSVGKDGLKLMIPVFMESNAYVTPAEHPMTLRFYYYENEDDFDPQIKEVNVKLTITPMPYIMLDKEEMVFNAKNDSDILTDVLTISNYGEYKLDYQIVLDPTGEGEEPDMGGGEPGIDPMLSNKLSREAYKGAEPAQATLELGNKVQVMDVKPEQDHAYNVPQNFEYNDALFYPHINGGAAWTYGTSTIFDEYKASTTFTAPEGGFNISHLYTAVATSGATNYNVHFDIVLGADPEGTEVIGTGNLFIDKQTSAASGELYVFPLDKPVYLNEGEVFTVVATYEAGAPYPAFLTAVEEQVVANRYQGWVESYGWFDIAEFFKDQLGSVGYLLSCIETVEGTPWIRILNSETSGSVEVGESAPVTIEVNAATARLEKNNKAMLVIKSNDTQNPLINFPIVLNCNGKPVLTVPSSVVAAKENETTNVTVTVSDPDGDDMEFGIADTSGHAKVTSYTIDEADTEATVTATEDDTYVISGATKPVAFNVAITPDYGTASTGNSFVATVVDSKDHYVSGTVRYEIEFVNRAPIAKEAANIELTEGATSGIYYFEPLFEDPDEDAMTYAFSMAANEYVEAFTTATGVIFNGLKPGTATATVTATDANGASATNTLTIVVNEFSGVEDVTADVANGLKVMPNPVDEQLNALCGFDAVGAEFTLYSNDGTVYLKHEADVTAGDVVSMNASSVPAGIYLLTVTYEDGAKVIATRVVKR